MVFKTSYTCSFYSAIKATSAGFSDGNNCSIQINDGQNICPKNNNVHGRGYNVVAFDPYTGQKLFGSFDTHGNRGHVMTELVFM